MIINSKYRINEIPFELSVIKAFDFIEEPILLLEQDVIGNNYLSYLVDVTNDIEKRIYVQISNERLNKLTTNEISVRDAFSKAENNCIYIVNLSLFNGTIVEIYLLPINIFQDINPIPIEYKGI